MGLQSMLGGGSGNRSPIRDWRAKENRVFLGGQEDASTPALPQNLLEAQPLCRAGAMATAIWQEVETACAAPPFDRAHLPGSSRVGNSEDVPKDEHGVESHQRNVQLIGRGGCHIP